MNKVIYIFCFLILCFVSCKPAAYKSYLEGKKQAENLNYSVGIDKYLESWNRSPLPETARGLAQAYFKTRDFEQAEEWYTRLDRDDELETEDLKPYAESLIANSKYAEAADVLAKLDPSKSRSDLELIWKTAEGGKSFLNRSSEAAVVPISNANSPFSEFGPMITENSVLHFTSDRLISKKTRVDPNNALKSDVYGWTGNGFLKMYELDWDDEENSALGDPKLTENLESDLHVGPMFEVGENLFLTLTQAQKFKKSDSGTARNYTLFPTNGDERTPFVDHNGVLYFSSSGHAGLGGLDVFKASFVNGDYAEPENLGSPINSNRDDFGLSLVLGNDNKAVFSSDRSGGRGLDDLYFANLIVKKDQRQNTRKDH